MPVELLERLLVDLTNTGTHFNAVFPFWLGESLLHPRFAAIFERLMEWNFANARFNHLEFDSNAHFLDEAMTDHLLSFQKMQVLAPDTFLRLDLSLDSIKPDIYRKIRPGGNPVLPIQNALHFLAERHRRKIKWPRVTLQMVVQEANASQVQEFCEFFRNETEQLGIPLSFAYARNKDAFSGLDDVEDAVFLRPLYTSAEQQPAADELFDEVIATTSAAIPWQRVSSSADDQAHCGTGNRSQPTIQGCCHYLMTRPLVTIDGDVLPCFNDEGASVVLGNIREQSFSNIWNGSRAQELRILQSKSSEQGRCFKECHGYTLFREQSIPPRRAEISIPPEELP